MFRLVCLNPQLLLFYYFHCTSTLPSIPHETTSDVPLYTPNTNVSKLIKIYILIYLHWISKYLLWFLAVNEWGAKKKKPDSSKELASNRSLEVCMLTIFSEDHGIWHFFHLTIYCDECRIQRSQNQGYNCKLIKCTRN